MANSRKKKKRSGMGKKLGAGKGDVAHTAARALIAATPIVGGPLAQIFSSVFPRPLEKKLREWVETLSNDVKRLEDKSEGVNIEALANDERFRSILLHATQIAMRTSGREKLEALRSAVLNSALPSVTDGVLQQMFLNFVDGFTVWHVRILKFLDDPSGWISKSGLPKPAFFALGPSHLLEYAFPGLKERRDLYDQIVKDLFSKGLVDIEELHIMMSMEGASASRTTTLGKQFISFITSPMNSLHLKE